MGYSFKKVKKYGTITKVFQKVLDESGCKLNKVRVRKTNQF